MFKLASLVGLVPEAVKLAKGAIKEIRKGNAEKAALLAKEAAERQALYAAGREQLNGW